MKQVIFWSFCFWGTTPMVDKAKYPKHKILKIRTPLNTISNATSTIIICPREVSHLMVYVFCTLVLAAAVAALAAAVIAPVLC
jgi:hypothetical protein